MMLILVVISIALFASFGISGDLVLIHMESNTALMDVPDQWDTSGTIDIIYSLFLFSLALPGILGIFIFLIAASRRQKIDTYREKFVPTYPNISEERAAQIELEMIRRGF